MKLFPIIFYLSLTSSAIFAEEGPRHPFASANVVGTVGEADTLYLVPNGAYVDMINNDVFGNTDKYLTHSAALGYIWNRNAISGFDFRLSWYFITPRYEREDTFNTEFEKPRKRVIGRYSDWIEQKVGYARVLNSSESYDLRFQVQGGFGHIGPKGAREIQRGFHKSTNNTYRYLNWKHRNTGYTASSNLELSLMPKPTKLEIGHLYFKFGYGATSSPIMTELYLRSNTQIDFGEKYGADLEMRVSRQIESIIYDEMEFFRYEASLGFKVFNYFKPSIKVVSSFLKYDDAAQVYFDPLAINIPL